MLQGHWTEGSALKMSHSHTKFTPKCWNCESGRRVITVSNGVRYSLQCIHSVRPDVVHFFEIDRHRYIKQYQYYCQCEVPTKNYSPWRRPCPWVRYLEMIKRCWERMRNKCRTKRKNPNSKTQLMLMMWKVSSMQIVITHIPAAGGGAVRMMQERKTKRMM